MEGNGFNIFDYIDEMKKAGMPHEQADAVGKALNRMASEGAATKHDLDLARLALKKDIEGVRAELKKDIEGVRAELKKDIEGVRAELKKDIEGVRRDIEGVRTELKKDLKNLEDRIGLKMVITSGSFAFLILGSLVTLVKLGLLSPGG